jgi:hypothetical protein
MPPAAPIELDAAATAMLARLDSYLPLPAGGLPVPTITIAALQERSVGLGGQRGLERRGELGMVELRGVRVEATVRFQLWRSSFAEGVTESAALVTRLLADRPALFGDGVLKLTLDDTALPVEVEDSKWLATSDYRILYEHRVADTGGAESLIARIEAQLAPETASQLPETVAVTDDLVRWDELAAPPLVVRGPTSVPALAALAFVEGVQPSGRVTLRRTHDGAAGAPPVLAFDAFVDAVAGEGTPQRHAEARFTSPAAFLAVLTGEGEPIELGDRAGDLTPDVYEPRVARLSEPIRLASTADRLEIFHEHAALDQPAVIYLRVGRAVRS